MKSEIMGFCPDCNIQIVAEYIKCDGVYTFKCPQCGQILGLYFLEKKKKARQSV